MDLRPGLCCIGLARGPFTYIRVITVKYFSRSYSIKISKNKKIMLSTEHVI